MGCLLCAKEEPQATEREAQQPRIVLFTVHEVKSDMEQSAARRSESRARGEESTRN